MNEHQFSQMCVDVQRMISTYARTMDGRDIPSCAALFAEDAVIEVMGQRHAGLAAIRTWMNELAKTPPGIHLTANTLVQAAGEGEATAVSDVAFIKQVDGAWRILTAGRYEDRLRRTDSEWRFVSRRIVLT